MARALRLAVGPLVTLATVCAILATDRYLFAVPNPGAITFVAVVFATYLGGLASGFASAAISLIYAAGYFSVVGELLHFRPDNLARMMVLIFGTPAIVIMVGVLQRRAERGLRQERATRLEIENANRELRRLQASLDKIEDGVVLLDSELRAQFINRAFRKMWRLPDDKADGKPPFVALMYHGRETRAYAVPESELAAYVAERTAKVRAGDETPIDLRLVNGEVIRFNLQGAARWRTHAELCLRDRPGAPQRQARDAARGAGRGQSRRPAARPGAPHRIHQSCGAGAWRLARARPGREAPLRGADQPSGGQWRLRGSRGRAQIIRR